MQREVGRKNSTSFWASSTFPIHKNLMAVCHTCSRRLQLLPSWWLVFREEALLAKCGMPSTAAVITASRQKAAKPACWWNSLSWLRKKRIWLEEGWGIWLPFHTEDYHRVYEPPTSLPHTWNEIHQLSSCTGVWSLIHQHRCFYGIFS